MVCELAGHFRASDLQPGVFQGAIFVDSVVPASNVPTSCSTNLDAGFTYAISVANGAYSQRVSDLYEEWRPGVGCIGGGVRTDATGSVYTVKTVEGTSNIIYQNGSRHSWKPTGQHPLEYQVKRLTWIERR